MKAMTYGHVIILYVVWHDLPTERMTGGYSGV